MKELILTLFVYFYLTYYSWFFKFSLLIYIVGFGFMEPCLNGLRKGLCGE